MPWLILAAIAAGAGVWLWHHLRNSTLIAAEPEFRLGLHDGHRLQAVEGRRGRVSLPAGQYLLHAWTVRMRDERGRTWEIDRDAGEPSRRIEVLPGRTARLPLAVPVEPDLVIQQTRREVLFRLRLRGASGETCGAVRVDGRLAPRPRLRLEDARGRVVARLRFEDTCGDGCVQVWRPPPGLAQPLKAVPEVDLGPIPQAATAFRFRLEQHATASEAPVGDHATQEGHP
jgi:hypothetical protein